MRHKRPEPLNLYPEELGYIMASIPAEGFEKMKEDMPKLYLKLMIMMTKYYLGHPTMGRQAQSDLIKLKSELEGLTKPSK